MIKASQIRAARAMAGLSIEDLAKSTGLGSEAIAALESDQGVRENSVAAEAVKRVLEQAGIVFMTAGESELGGDGIVMKRSSSSSDGIRPENLDATNDD